MTVRMKDLAKDLNLSVGTISKVLRNHSDISEKTRERVLQRMRELNFRPNLTARALVTGRTSMMGLIVPDLVHPFFGQIAKSLARTLRKKGYGLVISSAEEDIALERHEIEHLIARRVDALVIASGEESGEMLAVLEQQKIPYVLVDRQVAGLQANFVGVDDREVGLLATQHLIQQGCRRVAHLRGPETSPARGRIQGYGQALQRHGLTMRDAYVVAARSSGDRAEECGFEAMQKLLQSRPRPDGVFCFNDPLAVGALKAAQEAGLEVPRDLAVIGCGNMLYADMLRIPLSSIDQDTGSIGENAGKLALSLVEAAAPPKPRSVLVTPRVVERMSSNRLGR